jgi:cephalosporin hydroxylase
MKTLEEIFKQNTGRRVCRHNHVLEAYAQYFERFRGQPVRVLEIGIKEGGSLLMWREYFGDRASVFGLDITTAAADSGMNDESQILVLAPGNQGDPEFMAGIAKDLVEIDIVIDDGSHHGPDQLVSFEALFPIMADNGIYAIEDLHCAYRENYRGGYLDPRSIIEFTKQIPDWFHCSDIPGEYMEDMPEWIRDVYALHYFRNMLLIEKSVNAHRRVGSPLLTGVGTVADDNHKIMGSRFNVQR